MARANKQFRGQVDHPPSLCNRVSALQKWEKKEITTWRQILDLIYDFEDLVAGFRDEFLGRAAPVL